MKTFTSGKIEVDSDSPLSLKTGNPLLLILRKAILDDCGDVLKDAILEEPPRDDDHPWRIHAREVISRLDRLHPEIFTPSQGELEARTKNKEINHDA